MKKQEITACPGAVCEGAEPALALVDGGGFACIVPGADEKKKAAAMTSRRGGLFRNVLFAGVMGAVCWPAFAEDTAGAADAGRDLTGVWTIRSLTPLERPVDVSGLVLSEEEALAREAAAADRAQAGNARSNLNDNLLESGSSGGRNSFWVDPGERVTRIDGEARSSAIVSPEDGRIPFIDREKSTAGAIYMRQEYAAGRGDLAGPESIPLRARCLVGFGNTGGPGMAPVPYNSTYRFVLTEDHLMILVEMIHDARIVPIFDSKTEAQAGHRPDVITPWLGDSVAWWEDDALVIETINVNPVQNQESTMPLSKDGVATERLRRIANDAIYYAFEYDDPAHYTQPWKAEQIFGPVEGDVFEYACHEGSYARDDLLEAARRADRKAQ